MKKAVLTGLSILLVTGSVFASDFDSTADGCRDGDNSQTADTATINQSSGTPENLLDPKQK